MNPDPFVDDIEQRELVLMDKQMEFQFGVLGQNWQNILQVSDAAAAFGMNSIDQNPQPVALQELSIHGMAR